jgi:hypothetical protein
MPFSPTNAAKRPQITMMIRGSTGIIAASARDEK